MRSSILRRIDALNPAQRAAVLHEDGPALVVAGAGSGKTRVVTLRIARLIADRQVNPENILAVTFTNKAANEMKARIADLVGRGPASLLTVSTFHSFCVRVLREHIERLGYRRNFSIAAEGDTRTLIKRVVQDLEDSGQSFSNDLVREYIGRMKSLAAPEDFVLESAPSPESEANRDKYRQWMPEIYDRYQAALRAANSVDFDDLIALVATLWHTDNKVLDICRARYRYVLVDEFQDTNRPQFDLIRALAGPTANLMAVGDDDQSIYGWRGADVRNILKFERHFERVKLYFLTINYRSTARILRAANAVIAHNRHRREKELVAAQTEGRSIDVIHAVDDEDEAHAVVDRVRYISNKTHANPGDFAVLYRSNIQSRPFEIALRRAGIPYVVHGGQAFFDRTEIRDVLAYLRLIVNPYDEAAFLRIVNVPRRGIGNATLEAIHRIAAARGISFGKAMAAAIREQHVTGAPAAGLRTFLGLMKTHRHRFANHTAKLPELMRGLIGDIGYRAEIERTTKSPEAAQRKWECIDALLEAAADYEARAGHPSLREFIDEVALDSNAPERRQDRRDDAVNLMTIHSAKGLEFPFVFIVGLEEGFLPHAQCLESTQTIEEERRVFYVALTRAQRHITLLASATRRRGAHTVERARSRFLNELPAREVRELSGRTANATGPVRGRAVS